MDENCEDEDITSRVAELQFSNEIRGMHKSLVETQHALSKWQEVSLSNLLFSLDEEALKITELQEEYLGRRKSLALKTRAFTKSFLSSSAVNDIDAFKAASKEIVDFFKAEFDTLAESCRFAENCFLSLYKVIREVPDPVLAITAAAEACDKGITTMIKAQGMFHLTFLC